MSSTSGNNFGHGASPFTGPNQVLVSGVLGQRTTVDMNSVPTGSLLGRTATGVGAIDPSTIVGVLPAEDGTVSAPGIAFAAELGTGFYRGTDTLEAAVNGIRAMLVQDELAEDGSQGGTALGVMSNAESKCVAVGYAADASGELSVAIGPTASAASVATIAIGNSAEAGGNSSMALGNNAQTNAANCIAFGDSTITQTAGCIAIGQNTRAGGTNTISIGAGAGRTTLGNQCIAIGTGALANGSTSVTQCVAIGHTALDAAMNGTAQQATAIGFGSLGALVSGAGNTGAGFNAGSSITSGGNGSFFGAGANGGSGFNGQTCIGAGASSGSDRTVALGQNASAASLQSIAIGFSASSSVSNGLAFPTTLAQVASGLAVQFNAGAMGPTTSSIRFKKDVTLASTIDDTPGQLKPFDRIRIVEFDSKVDGDEKRHLGIIAEELVDLVHPSLIPRDVEGNPVGISYDRLVCLAIQEIQLLRRRVSILESAPLPDLGVYVPVRARDLYDDDQIDDETQTLQKQQYKDRSRQLRIDRVVERIEKNPARETAILNRLNKVTRDLVRKAMEDKAALEAQAEAKAEAEAQAEKEAKLNAIARRKMAEGKADEAGPKMKARIAALVEADRVAAEAQAQARAEAAAEAQRQAKALEDADKALEEADEQE